jgi:hypothetical protein
MSIPDVVDAVIIRTMNPSANVYEMTFTNTPRSPVRLRDS